MVNGVPYVAFVSWSSPISGEPARSKLRTSAGCSVLETGRVAAAAPVVLLVGALVVMLWG